jgi:hypothetical protein
MSSVQSTLKDRQEKAFWIRSNFRFCRRWCRRCRFPASAAENPKEKRLKICHFRFR